MTSFSIIIPVYNRAEYIGRTLESVIKQTVRPLEVILVDNASTDNSVAVCQEFITKHSSLLTSHSSPTISLLSEPTPGAARARNTGLSAATGDWVYFFDSDDEMSADFLSDVQTAIETYTDPLDLIANETRMQFDDGTQKVRAAYHTDSVSDQILTSMLSTVSMVFRREFLQNIGAWNPTLRIWDDWELGIRTLLARPRMTWLTKKAYHTIYIHPNSITGANFSGSYERLKSVLTEVSNLLRTNSNSNSKDFAAFQFRAVILAAQLRREGKPDMSKEIYKTFCPSTNLFIRLSLQFIYFYTYIGGKGSWWIAKHIVALQ